MRQDAAHATGDRGAAGEPRLRVVYIDHVARMSGGEIALLRLLPALSHDVAAHVVLGEEGPLAAALEEAGVGVEILPMDHGLRDVRRDQVSPGRIDLIRLLRLARYVWVLRARLRALRPDIVHTNSLKSALYGGVAGRMAGIPVVWHIRDRIAEDYLPRPAVWLVRVLSRWLPSIIVANSQTTLSTLPATHRTAVLYNPVVPDVAPDPGPSHERNQGPLRIGVVGRLSEWKGQHVFLRAFAQAFPDGEEEAWIIGSAMFGEDDYEGNLRSQAVALGISQRVRWRGFQADIPAELAQIDVLVHCSVTPEPFGQVVVEGMAAGLPVVAAAAGGPTEIITDGQDGLLTAPGDSDDLADALRRLAKDEALRRRLGAAGQESSRRFSPEAARQRLLAVYRLLDSADPAPR